MKTLQQVAFETLKRFVELQGAHASEIVEGVNSYHWTDPTGKVHFMRWDTQS